MPEGDTLYRTAAALRKALLHREVIRLETAVPGVALVDERTPVRGRIVTEVAPRGKNLLMRFSLPDIAAEAEARRSHAATDLVLHTHLRMTGSWHIYRPGEPWQKPARYAKVVVHTDAYVAPCFSAPVVELLTDWQAQRHQGLQELGPDAITPEFDQDEAKRRIRGRPETEIAVALLNQRLLAGVGNIFKSEVLFVCRVSPFARVGSLSDEVVEQLVSESHRLLRLNREGGERRTMNALDSSKRLWVYGRSGEPCRVCGATVRMRRQGMEARSTYYCPSCQGVGQPF
ncbi:MAG: Fpg/Nei family DNA glycosylase [Actinomycetota bacterium]